MAASTPAPVRRSNRAVRDASSFSNLGPVLAMRALTIHHTACTIGLLEDLLSIPP